VRRKNLSCVWIDVKKAFDSVNLKWLELCPHMLSILDKIVKFITTILKNLQINLEVKTLDTKKIICLIKLNQGIFQRDSFCVRLFTICVNPCVAEKNTFSHHIQEKITHVLFVDDLKTFHKSTSKVMLMAGKRKNMFEDMVYNGAWTSVQLLISNKDRSAPHPTSV